MNKRFLTALFALACCITPLTATAAEAETKNEIHLSAGESSTLGGVTYTAGKKAATIVYEEDNSDFDEPFISVKTGTITCQLSGGQSVVVAYEDPEFGWYTNPTKLQPIKGTLDVTLSDMTSENAVTLDNKETAEIAGVTYSYAGSKPLTLSFGFTGPVHTDAVSGQLRVSADDNYTDVLNYFSFTETDKPAFTIVFGKNGDKLTSGAVMINTLDVPSVLVKVNGVSVSSNYAVIRVKNKYATVEGSAAFTDKKGKASEIHGNYDSGDDPYGKAKISTNGTVKIIYDNGEKVSAADKKAEKAEAVTYTVKKGDTLYAIAKKYNSTVAKILTANKTRIKNPNFIQIGWKLTIPQS